MVHAIQNLYRLQLEWIFNALEAADIKAECIGLGAALVVRVDATDRAEIVLRRPGIELIKTQIFLARNNFKPIERHGGNDGAPSPAHGTSAMARFKQSVRQRKS